MLDYVQNVQNFNCTGGFDCKPAGLHPKRQKSLNQQNQTKKERKRKTPHQRTPSETKPRNLVLASLKACSVPGMG